MSYFAEVSDAFVRARNKGFMVSALDTDLITEWEERKIPLHIVLRVIERLSGRKPGVRWLSYYADAIETDFKEYLSSQIGSSDFFADDEEFS